MATVESVSTDGLLSGWDVYTSLIATLIVLVLGYSVFFTKEPDTHPFILARQAIESPVRQQGESAILRSLDAPVGFPLKGGLGVKDPDTPKWTSGRRGDLRDIWRTVVRGTLNGDGTPSGKHGAIYTVLGKNLIQHKIDDISQEINVIGQYIRDAKVQKAAICLSDSVELLTAIFASAFYGFETVIIPHNLPSEALAGYLQQTQADLLIAEAGTIDVSTLLNARTALKHAIWVAKQGSRHMDWNEVPEGVGGKIEVAVWHELVKERVDIDSELPPLDPKSPTPSLTTLRSSPTGPGEFVTYTPGNLVSAIAALGASLPRDTRLTPADLLLSIDSLSRSYTLCMTMALLYVNGSVAFNSVAGEVVDFTLATGSLSPTIIIASSHTMSDFHAQLEPRLNPFAKLGRYIETRGLEAGVMPPRSFFSILGGNVGDASTSFEKLRLLFIPHRIDENSSNMLSSEQLTDLRLYTGARIVYALTFANVAGAICQTNPYDYRTHSGPGHFGPPVGSVEIKLTGYKEKPGDERAAEGQIHVSGPAVVSGQCDLGVQGHFRDDNTLLVGS